MYKLKPIHEILEERENRSKKSKHFVVLLFMLSLWFIYYLYPTTYALIEEFKSNPEKLLGILVIPILIFSGHYSYVEYGSPFYWAPGKVCLGCSRTWHHSNDGWGFMKFGKGKKKWYQIKTCSTPEKCNIVGHHEVIWVDKEE